MTSVMSWPAFARMPEVNVVVGDALTRMEDEPGTFWLVEAADDKFFVTNLYAVIDEAYMTAEKLRHTPRTYINKPQIKTLIEQGFYKVEDFISTEPME